MSKHGQITRQYATLKAAMRYQGMLYNRYSYVYLVRSPFFSESGLYTWEVRS